MPPNKRPQSNISRWKNNTISPVLPGRGKYCARSSPSPLRGTPPVLRGRVRVVAKCEAPPPRTGEVSRRDGGGDSAHLAQAFQRTGIIRVVAFLWRFRHEAKPTDGVNKFGMTQGCFEIVSKSGCPVPNQGMRAVADTALFFLTLFSGFPGLLLGPQLVDGGGHFVLPGKFLIAGRVVGWQIRYLHAEVL